MVYDDHVDSGGLGGACQHSIPLPRPLRSWGHHVYPRTRNLYYQLSLYSDPLLSFPPHFKAVTTTPYRVTICCRGFVERRHAHLSDPDAWRVTIPFGGMVYGSNEGVFLGVLCRGIGIYSVDPHDNVSIPLMHHSECQLTEIHSAGAHKPTR
jgi:hypothetical protein